MTASTPTDLGTVRLQLQRLRHTLERTTRALAIRCSGNGKLDPVGLDRFQIPSFELAWAAADLLAAENALDLLRADSLDLDVRLALLFAADASADILGRLETIAFDVGTDPTELQQLRADPDFLAFRQSASSSEGLATTGQAIAQSQAEVGTYPLDEQHALAYASFRRFSREVVAPMAERIHRQDLTVPESLLQPLREMGVFGLSVPERFGGSAPNDRGDSLLMVLVTEALSEGSLAAAGGLITRPEILTRALLAGGTREQQEHWLPRIAAGDPLCAISITEPDHGSDVASLTLKATRTQGGWRLDGAKTWCTFAGKAGVLMVVARTDPDRSLGHRGLSVFLVEKPSFEGHEFAVRQGEGGALTGRAIPTIGYRGMHSFDLAFENFFVPGANLLGGDAGLGKGFYFTMAGMVGGRMQTAARACGVMRAALKAAIRHCEDRKVFGQALLAYPLTQAKLARMGARLAACRQLACTVARQADRGEGRMEASLVKLLACRSAEIVTREALQLHGGLGYAEESAVSRYFVDARVLSIFEGAEETLALKVVARSLMERALGVAGSAA